MRFIILFLLWLPMPLGAATWHLAATSGLMVQPASNYYLFVYGTTVEVDLFSDRLLLRAGYLERPKFQALGYVDQEFSGYGLIGAKAFTHGRGSLLASVGWGELAGYIDHSDEDPEAGIRQRYRLAGPAFHIAYRFIFGSLSVALGHQTLIAFIEEEQTRAYVAWPYNFILSEIGWVW